MNYAKTQPELVILAVNTFVKVSFVSDLVRKRPHRRSIPYAWCRAARWRIRYGVADNQDTADPNPLVRALAIRTMSVLRAEKILDYLASPLSRCLKDENPYVRKTAALCVAKVFDLKPELCIEYGFIETLRDLIGDGNPMVSVAHYTLPGSPLARSHTHVLIPGRRQCCGSPGRHSRSIPLSSSFPSSFARRIITAPLCSTGQINVHHRCWNTGQIAGRAERMFGVGSNRYIIDFGAIQSARYGGSGADLREGPAAISAQQRGGRPGRRQGELLRSPRKIEAQLT